jgi:FMN reductase
MRILIVTCSLKSDSRSFLLGQAAAKILRDRDIEVDLRDLREIELPLCDAGKCYSHPNTVDMATAIREASAIILAVPIYNYNVNAAAKNLIELTGRNWTEKTVGFVCAAGGQGSYMSVMNLANNLMLDFRCLINPRFVYATGEDFQDDQITSEKIQLRLEELCTSTIRLAGALETDSATEG